MTEVHSGAWRPVTKDQAETLAAKGANVDWLEGAGHVVYDQQALDEFRAQSALARMNGGRAMAKTYDCKCFDLAEHFLSDEPAMNCEEACDELAYLIQTTIEDWISCQRKQHEAA